MIHALIDQEFSSQFCP